MNSLFINTKQKYIFIVGSIFGIFMLVNHDFDSDKRFWASMDKQTIKYVNIYSKIPQNDSSLVEFKSYGGGEIEDKCMAHTAYLNIYPSKEKYVISLLKNKAFKKLPMSDVDDFLARQANSDGYNLRAKNGWYLKEKKNNLLIINIYNEETKLYGIFIKKCR